MTLFLISILVMGLVMAGMAVGVLAGRAPIQGSCVGMGALCVDTACDLSGGNPQRCVEETRSTETGKDKGSQYYRADK